MIIITTISVDKEHAPAQEVHRVYPFVAGRNCVRDCGCEAALKAQTHLDFAFQ